MAATLAGVALTPAPALAQDNDEARIRKLEAEVRALQRRVFPGADGRFFEPQIDTARTGTSTAPTTSTTAVTDILARLDAVETSLQRLTGQVEENSNTLLGLTTRMAALEQGGVAVAATSGAATGAAGGASTTTTRPSGGEGATSSAARTVAAPETTPATAAPSPERLAAVQQIAKPQTDDSADDEYSYGFRLWDAGFYPEAQQQLAMFVDKYPDHWRATYGRNLLGRAYLDDGKPREAAPWFLRNYQDDRNAARAPDSLLYLAETMIALEDTSRACIALAEFGETYPALAAGRLQDQYEANRAKVSCN
ncbi:tetratricopeptide repeat protein [Erythrobacter litoralis]|uniref:Uncharacterized protein n=1 Tax=Erythrobacter litoralis (strain HTCC2594) TaxID=314225 RepID=Q2NDP7_ERYLH|nr:tetratricopeptide repeat protein [Erythrobacter litoralis]ABC62194.1 hypothetical protein ELI_00510 [Erythrobacter litoralis HTCC2594]